MAASFVIKSKIQYFKPQGKLPNDFALFARFIT